MGLAYISYNMNCIFCSKKVKVIESNKKFNETEYICQCSSIYFRDNQIINYRLKIDDTVFSGDSQSHSMIIQKNKNKIRFLFRGNFVNINKDNVSYKNLNPTKIYKIYKKYLKLSTFQ